MKKLVTTVLLFVMAALMLFSTAGCSGENKDNVNVVGTWTFAVENSGEKYNYQQAEMYKPIVESMNAVLEFKEGGKVIITAKIGEKESKEEGSWKLADGVLTLTDPTGAATVGAGSVIKYTYKDGRFVPETGIIGLVRK